jgi:hypothetical protein
MGPFFSQAETNNTDAHNSAGTRDIFKATPDGKDT